MGGMPEEQPAAVRRPARQPGLVRLRVGEGPEGVEVGVTWGDPGQFLLPPSAASGGAVVGEGQPSAIGGPGQAEGEGVQALLGCEGEEPLGGAVPGVQVPQALGVGVGELVARRRPGRRRDGGGGEGEGAGPVGGEQPGLAATPCQDPRPVEGEPGGR